MPSPFQILGLTVLAPPYNGAAPTAPGRIVLDLGGPPGGEVIGVRLADGRMVFRHLLDCVAVVEME